MSHMAICNISAVTNSLLFVFITKNASDLRVFRTVIIIVGRRKKTVCLKREKMLSIARFLIRQR